tara:strand:- start:20843 stop:22684 length:1842 start_codon:yes stop_codon:yes gene_type:complete
MLDKDKMKGLIETHRAKANSEQKEWDQMRSWYTSDAGDPSGDVPQGAGSSADEELHMETNYPYAFVDTMVANICPSNPEVTVNARRKELHEAARYRQALINDSLKRLGGHRVLWRAATMAAVYPRSFVKVVWNFKRRSPDLINVDPRNVWYDMSVNRWEDIRYTIEVTVLTRADFEKRIRRIDEETGEEEGMYDPEIAGKAQFGAYPEWLRDRQKDRSLVSEASKEVFEWTTVYEVYDFSGDGMYYHCLDEQDSPLFEGELPYRFVRNPFFLLSFNDNLSDIGGLSDVKLIKPVLERLNELDTLMLWFAQTAIPITLVNTGLVDNPEHIQSQLRDATSPGSIVSVHGKANARISDIIGHTQTPGLSPEFMASRDRCIQVIEFILGIPQYSRGVVGVADVATEVALADSATRTRNGRRMKVIYDLIGWQAQVIVGLYEEFLAEDEIMPIRLLGSHESLEITRASMMAREILASRGENPLEYDYEAVAYSPTENNRLVQLKNISQYYDLLAESPVVDQERFARKLLELLQLEDVAKDPAQMEADKQQAQQQAAAQAPQQGEVPSEEDTRLSGALPPGTEPMLPPSPTGGAIQGGEGQMAGFGGAPFSLPPGVGGK